MERGAAVRAAWKRWRHAVGRQSRAAGHCGGVGGAARASPPFAIAIAIAT
jgi:hypothetical protein